ncbi:MAG TPA: hypothetical protein VFB78_00605 [Acidimicrobiales bacterium]|jgi:hypothetical protein|nr:hypothetical protein [Acidimicrobiales bacterium]
MGSRDQSGGRLPVEGDAADIEEQDHPTGGLVPREPDVAHVILTTAELERLLHPQPAADT